ncbi:MAG TPA: DUF885 domain-containing protein [Gemmatimonadaceae bacterium]|nr:DUF885 domain-containing protein [Gemmatimonadaceae bacterium]
MTIARPTLALVVLLASALPLPCAAQQGSQGAARLRALMEAAWEFELRDNPLMATRAGDHRYDDRLPGMSSTDLARRRDSVRAYLTRLAAIDRRALQRQDQVSAAMLELRLRTQLEELDGEEDRIPILVDAGFHIGLAQLPSYAPRQTVKDVESYIARLRQTPRYFREHIALMRRGMATKFTMPRVVLDGYEVTIASHVVDDPTRGVFYRPLTQLPDAMPEADKERLRAAAAAAIRDSVVPAYREFLTFMTGEYIPAARTTIAASDLPDGRAYYVRQVRKYTTLNLSPDSIHALGLAEVARIEAEMEQAMRRTGFTGTMADFLRMLRTDARFYPTTPDELLRQASWIAKRMDGKLPSLFKTLPRQPYGVEPVPEHLAPKYTAGRYVGAPTGGVEAAKYWVNTYNLPSRPYYSLEALTLHEAVPGHHLQSALAQELEDLPDFRRHTYLSAFGEGWGLYSERLGLEAGFYTDPYSDFGRLTYEMWRACRLVVDTGIHWKGWTRDQVLKYMADHTALSLHEVRTETDRYISWPAQALAYKLGELKIRELRARAERSLGARFDIREFHDAVLRNGSVPLPVLEAEIDAYIGRAREGT